MFRFLRLRSLSRGELPRRIGGQANQNTYVHLVLWRSGGEAYPPGRLRTFPTLRFCLMSNSKRQSKSFWHLLSTSKRRKRTNQRRPNIETLRKRTLWAADISISGNDLLIVDSASSNDDLELFENGSDLLISDPANLITTSIAGATGSGTNNVTIPLASLASITQIVIQTGGGDDDIEIGDLGALTNVDVTVDGQADDDFVDWQGDEPVGTVNVTGEVLQVFPGGEIITTGSDSVQLTAGSTFQSFGDITTDAGNITIQSNLGVSPATNNFGVSAGTITTATGAITIEGQGNNDFSQGNGVLGTISSTGAAGAGAITIIGEAAGLSGSGVAASVTSVSADISITGTSNPAGSDPGVTVAGSVTAGGTGDLIISGSGAGGVDLAATAVVSTDTGTLTFTSSNEGLDSLAGSSISSNGEINFAMDLASTVDGVISGSGNVNVNSGGDVALNAANTYTGVTTINGPTLVLESGATLGDATGGTTINGGTLELGFGASNNDVVTFTGSGSTLRADTSGAQLGNIVLAATDSAIVTTVAGGSISLNGDISGSVSGAGVFQLGMSGQSDQVFLTGNNTYTATTEFASDGQAFLSDLNVIPDDSTVRVSGAGGFLLNGSSETIGALEGNNAGADIDLSIYTLTTGGNDADTVYAGDISGTGNVIKTGLGQQDFTGATTYTGTTTIQDGIVLVAASGTLGDASSPTVVEGGAELQLGALTHNEPLQLEDNAVLAGDGAALLTSDVTLVGDNGNFLVTTFNSSDTFTIDGDFVSSGVGNLVNFSVDGGTVVLNGNFTATGGLGVENGDLVINGTVNQPINAGNGGTLRGIGGTGPIFGLSGGTISPGFSPGITNSGNFDLQAGSTLEIELGGSSTNPGVDYDQVNVTGTVTLGGDLDAILIGNVTGNEEYVIINNDGADPVVGNFNGLAQGATVEIGGRDFTIRYDGDAASPGTFGGNDVVLTPALSTFYGSIWDGGGDGTSWEDPVNWDGDTLPGLAANVLIDAFGNTTTVTLTSGSEIVTNIHSNEKFRIDGGDLQVDSLGRFNGGLDLLSGFLYTNGTSLSPAQVNIGGSSNWQGGTIEGIGPDPDDSVGTLFGGSLMIDGGGTLDFTNITFDNQSNTVHDSVTINLSSAGIVNQPGGVYEMRGATIDDFGGASFINTNQLIVEGGTTSTIDAFFWNNEVPGFTGSVNVSNGTLNIEGTVQNVTGTVLNNEGTWEVGTGSNLSFTTEASIGTNQGNVTLRGTANFTNFTSPNANSGSITLADGHSLSTGPFTNSGTIEVDSTSTMVSLDTYTQSAGTTIVDGTFVMISGGGTPVASINGGTLAGDGMFDGAFPIVDINAGGTIAPGNSGAGSLSLPSTLNLDAASTTAIELSDGTAGVNYDQITVAGTPNVAGTLSLTSIGTVTAGQQFTIIDGSAAVSGTFAGLSEGATVSDGTNNYTITYVGGGDGFDVVLTAQAASAQTEVSLPGGNLLIEDTGSNTDTLRISTTATDFVIEDTGGNNLSTSIVGATGDGTSIITVPRASVTGNTVTVNTGGGDDDISFGQFLGANFDPGATFNVVADGGAGTDNITWGNVPNPITSIDATAETLGTNASPNTSGTQSWDGVLTVSFGGQIFTGTDVTFAGQVTGNAITVNASGATRFEGGINAQGVTTDAAGTTFLDGNVLGTTGVTFNDPVTFDTASQTISSDGAITIASTLDANGDVDEETLAINSVFGNVIIGGAIGNAGGLGSASFDGNEINLNGGSITTDWFTRLHILRRSTWARTRY